MVCDVNERETFPKLLVVDLNQMTVPCKIRARSKEQITDLADVLMPVSKPVILLV